jgi:hypothetical protein
VPGSATLQATHVNQLEWLFPIGAVALAVVVALAAVLFGRPRERWEPLWLLRRAGASLQRFTGLPSWAAAGITLQTWGLLVAGLGLYWDVAWHIDFGRDTELFTPPHVLILLGLAGFAVAGVVSCVFATLERAPTSWRLGAIRLPRGAAALFALGVTAAIGFPLDDLWHATYGVDVTMWSPTHLMMIGAGVASPFAAWLLWAEADKPAGRRAPRAVCLRLAIGCVLALSVLQLEFDDGVPQWQALYQPVLIAIAATLPMVAARAVLGRGAALTTALGFLLARGVVFALMGPGLGHVTPHFPLYLGLALCVEAGFILARSRGLLTASLLAGLLAGTLGLASEWGFSHLFGREPWQLSMLPSMWLPLLAAVAASLLGGAFGLALMGRRLVLPRALLAAAGLALVAALVVPLQRSALPVEATVLTTPAGPRELALDRYGQASFYQRVRVEVDIPASTSRLLRSADWFWVTSWQGGGRLAQSLHEVAPGRWVVAQPVPTGGAWKTIVLLARRDVVAAVPVALPADPALALRAVPVQRSRVQPFVPASRYLMREAHGGAGWPAIVAYAGWLLMLVLWVGLLVTGARSLMPRSARQRAALGREVMLEARRTSTRAPLHSPR